MPKATNTGWSIVIRLPGQRFVPSKFAVLQNHLADGLKKFWGVCSVVGTFPTHKKCIQD